MLPITAEPITTAGSMGDSGDGVGQGVGISSVNDLLGIAVVAGATGVFS